MKTKNFIYPILIGFIFVVASACSLHKSSKTDGSFSLKYKFDQSQIINVKSDSKSKIEQEQMGQSIVVDMTTSSVIEHKVLSVNADKLMAIEVKFKEMSQDMESPMGEASTDFSTWIGKTASYDLTGSGEANNIKGFESLPQITTASGETVGGEVYEQVIYGTFFKLPEHPVKIGDSWTNVDSTDMPFGAGNLNTISETIYLITEKLVVDGEDCLRFDVTSKAKTSGEFEQGGMQMSIKRTSTSSGNILFAYNKGMYLSMDMTSTTIGSVDIPAAGMEIPQTITSTAKSVVEFK